MSDDKFVKPMDVIRIKLEKVDHSEEPTLSSAENISVIKYIKSNNVKIKLENSNNNDEATTSTSNTQIKKGRKKGKKKTIITEPEKKLYNPRSMVRYDNAICNDNRPVWVCKNCLSALLSEEGALAHIPKCKKRMTFKIHGIMENQKTPKTLVAGSRQTSPEPYICQCCNLVFRRKVTLDQHLSKKKKAAMSDEEKAPKKKRSYKKVKK